MNSEPLHPGDVCLIVADLDGLFPDNVGRECTILSEEKEFVCWAGRPTKKVGYEGELPCGRALIFDRLELRKRRPPAKEMDRVHAIVKEAAKPRMLPVGFVHPVS